MNQQNTNVPAGQEDVDNLEDTQEYVDYLEYGVKEGWIDEDLANELIENEEWEKVRDMMFRGDEYFVDDSKEVI